MPEYTTTVPIPEPIVPRDPLEDVVDEQAIEVQQVDDGRWLAAVPGKLLAVEDTEAKAKRRAREHVGEHPPFVDKHGTVLEIDLGDVLRLAGRRPWIGRDPAQATLMIEVYQEYRAAERQGRGMELTKEQVELAVKVLTQPANPDPRAGDLFLAAAYTPVVVSQIHEHLIKRFQELAEGDDKGAKALPAPAPEKANGKSNGAAKAPAKKKRQSRKKKSGGKGRSRKRA